MKRLRPLLIAVQFLTRLPVRLSEPPEESELGRSLLYYPLVGVGIGAILMALAWLLRSAPPLLAAGLILAAWVLLTGALHLDGLADSADAWVGGLGNRERTLAIMKDPNCGPAGVVALVLVLLIKFAALSALLPAGMWPALLLAATLGRGSALLLFVTTDYVRQDGIGAAAARTLPRRAALCVLAITASLIPWVFGWPGVYSLAGFGGLFLLLRGMMMGRIGGMTGDTAGALLELTECATLVIFSLALATFSH